MAPRPTKAKKAADVKVAEPETLKKGRGKAKQVDVAEPELSDPEIVEKAAPEKKKRGRKPAETNGHEELNEAQVQKEPPAKRGRKKAAPELNGNGDKEESPASKDEVEQIENVEPNGVAEPAANGKGKKKQAKKETEKLEKPARGKKAKQESNADENEEAAEENAKPASKGRGRKVKTDKETEQKAENGEDVKTEPATKGRKKATVKSSPEPQSDKTDQDPKEDVPAPKGRKKTPAKADSEPQDEKLAEDQKEDEPAPKGKKKAANKVDPLPESEEDKMEEEQKEVLEKDEKKPAKGKKPQSKKAQTKGDAEEIPSESESAGKKKKVAKKEEKGNGDAKDEEPLEEEPLDSKSKGKKGQKKAVADAPEEADEELEDTGEPTNKRRRKAEEKAPTKDSKAKAPAKNKASTAYESIDFSNSSKNALGKEWNFKIASWNVDGIRAWMKKGGLDYIKLEKPDILCLQEVKCSLDKLPEEAANIPGYHAYWLCSEKDGYAGVGIYTTKLAMSVQYGLQNEELDSEGRIITAEYEEFYLICTYVPNAGRKLVTLDKRLQWNEEFRKHVKELDKKKPVIICGDMNVAHNEIDLKNPTTNRKNAGFTDEERSGMTELLSDGFIDTYRHLNPDKTGAYTFWTYMMNSRAKNTGWRLDYFIVSERLMPTICDNMIRDQVYGSDHCPITLFLHLTSAVLSNLRSN